MLTPSGLFRSVLQNAHDLTGHGVKRRMSRLEFVDAGRGALGHESLQRRWDSTIAGADDIFSGRQDGIAQADRSPEQLQRLGPDLRYGATRKVFGDVMVKHSVCPGRVEGPDG